MMKRRWVNRMSEGIKKNEPNAREVYADIIDMPHHQSSKHPHMSLLDRSAQFSSYKALSGYEDMVAEEARQTESELHLEQHDIDLLNQKLSLIADVTEDGENPSITITYFVPDRRKAGGKYVDVTDRIKRIDAAARKVVLCSTSEIGKINKTIDIDKISAISGELVT